MDRKDTKENADPRDRDRRSKAQKRRASVADDVVYTPAKPFSRGKLLLRLATVTAVAVALLLGLSIFFRVEEVLVSGTNKYTPWDISTASGIEKGDSLLLVGKAKASGRIITELPYVNTVQIGIELPNTVKIHITEIEVTYAIEDKDNHWWLMNSDGRIVEKLDPSAAEDYTRVLGIPIQPPAVGQNATAVELEQPEETIAGIPTEPILVTGQDHLQAALDILHYLEDNGIIGEMATVDVKDLGNLELWYGHRFHILLGDVGGLETKVEAAKQAIDQISPYQSGILDASFTIWPDQVILSPFS